MAGQEMHACFWGRGIIPAPWAQVTEPAAEELWRGGDLCGDGVGPGCLGHGTPDAPLARFRRCFWRQ
eukprot:9501897-Pyramimonas_sp.AAC.1